MRRRGPAVAAAVVLALCMCGPAREPLRPTEATGTSVAPPIVSGPPRAVAGAVVPVSVPVADGTVVTLVAVGSLGTSTFSDTGAGGKAEFLLPPSFTRVSGTVTLLAVTADWTARSVLDLVPGPAIGPVQAVVGPRSVVADGLDRSMVVTSPVDVWGNSIAEGSPLRVSRTSPAGVDSTTVSLVEHLLAWQPLVSGTSAGRGYVWVAAGAATGPAVSLDEVAGPPTPFILDVVDPTLATRTGADGRTLIELRTGVLRDRYANIEPDGTIVSVRWSGPQGQSHTEAVAISGVAHLWVQAPNEPETLTLSALCRGTTTGEPLRLTFTSALAAFGVNAVRTATDIAVTVGPVDRRTGSFAPDGTIVTVLVRDGSDHHESARGQLVDGAATVSLPAGRLIGALTVTASALGTTMTVVSG